MAERIFSNVSSRWLRRGLWLTALILAVALLRLTLLRTAPVPVTVFRAALGHVEETVTNSKAGTIKSRRRATLSTEVGGRVRELPVRKGARIRRGEILMRLADGDYRAQVSLQESALEAAKASRTESCRAADQADRELARQRQLAQDRIVSAELLDQFQSRRDVAVASCEAARARIRQAEAALEVSRVNLEKTVLKAPFDGVVADITTEVGEWITPSPPGLPIPPVIVVQNTEAIYVSAPMDEVDVGKVRVGQAVRITMDAYPGRPFSGRVTRVAPYVLDVQAQNRTFETEAEFDDSNLSRALLPGTSADVEVILSSRENVLRIPSYALLEGGKVLAVRDGKLVARVVKTRLKNWQFTEITDGLVPGDAIAVSLDRAEVKEGARVSIEAETTK